MKQGVFISVLIWFTVSTTVLPQTPVSPFESDGALTPAGRIDGLVLAKLDMLGIQPANLCSDAVFVRRVYLDSIGTLPTAQESRRFLLDRSAEKRRSLIDLLLEREEFADYWALKWGDLLRVKSEFPINLWPNAVQAYHRWILNSIRNNVPYDQFVRELLTANGSNFRVPQVNFYRAVQSREPETIAEAVALTFMGTRADRWTDQSLSGMAVFFSQVGYKSTSEWKEEIVFFDPLSAVKQDEQAVFPDGVPVRLPLGEDPRELFADWLIQPGNPWFSRNIVNRIWYWLLGTGIIHEPDDIRPDNPAKNPELLSFLEEELVAAGYDLKHIFRLILNSGTYQLSSISKTNHPEAEAYFSHYPARRLDAEVLIDGLCQITGTMEEYSSSIPEPFAFTPSSQRSIALADGSMTSSFLEMFGRPPRDSGLESERNNNPTAAQRLHLLNSTHIRRKIERSPKLRQLVRSNRDPMKTMRDLYLTVLSRFPTDEELAVLRSYSRSGTGSRREAFVDITWALINSAEFLYRH